MTNILLYPEECPLLNLTDEALPTRRFVVELEGFKKEHGPSRSWDSCRGRLSTIRPNWTGATTYNGKRIVSHIAIYYAITRFMFETEGSLAECLMNEDGGRGLNITFSRRLDTEGIIKSLFDGSRFYFKYKESKTIPPYEDLENYPIVRESDINPLCLDDKSIIAIDLLHTFRRMLGSSIYVPDKYTSYSELTPGCRHFRNDYFF